MAKVYMLTTAKREEPTPDGRLPIGAGERLATMVTLDRFKVHRLVDTPDEADLVLFVESYTNSFLDSIRRHPLVRQRRESCFCFCERAHTIPYLPGVYTALEQRWHRRDRTRGGFYLAMYQNQFIEYAPPTGDEPYLFSFRGARDTSRLRDDILSLQHTRCRLVDTTTVGTQVRADRASEAYTAFEREYAEELKQSKFVLCPRGMSPSSVRVFETMKTGRVPVIISDAWVPPEGPEWDRCCIRVKEAEVDSIPRLLEEHEACAREMGEQARRVWDAWFSPEVAFHRIVEWCLSIKATRKTPEAILRTWAYLQTATAPHRGRYVRYRVKRFLYR